MLTPFVNGTMNQSLLSISANSLRSCIKQNNQFLLIDKIHEIVKKPTNANMLCSIVTATVLSVQ